MLVLSRKQDQEIVIGDNIKVRVLKIKGNTIRLGIDAPRDIRVVRGELPVENEMVAEIPGSGEDVNVTIVFNNDFNKRNSKLDLIPFRRDEPDSRDIPLPGSHRVDEKRESKEPGPSISFREQLPQALHHNRLKELVKELTQNNSPNRSR